MATEQIFRFVMTHPSGERRRVAISAKSADEAAAILEEREARKVEYQLTAEDLAELEEGLRTGTLSAQNRARLLTHQQDVAYKVGSGKADN